MWKSILRLLISYLIISVFLWQLNFVDWYADIVTLYFNKTFIPCFGAAFILCSFADYMFEILGLLQRDYSNKYCVYVHH
jgi:hypothetical protein